MIFQSTPPTWEATYRSVLQCFFFSISIHAPHVGGDLTTANNRYIIIGFQSTPPTWEATFYFELVNAFDVFQSTPPTWEATVKTYNFFMHYYSACTNNTNILNLLIKGIHIAVQFTYKKAFFQCEYPVLLMLAYDSQLNHNDSLNIQRGLIT